MLVVAGLSIKNLHPRVWDPESPYHLPTLRAVMVSYAEFLQMPARRRAAMRHGLHKWLGVPAGVSIFLDNGAFQFAKQGGPPPAEQYRRFFQKAQPDWRPIPFDAIPAPQMPWQTQLACCRHTLQVNRRYQHDGYVPVIHAGRYIDRYIEAISANAKLAAKPRIAIGGLVPNLLRTPSAIGYDEILGHLIRIRQAFPNKKIHVFGVGGTATLHLVALLGFDSADSSGWRNRAARGIIQLPGSGERVIAELGSWRGRRPSRAEQKALRACPCPACQRSGLKGLRKSGVEGFCNRATHNLWILLQETEWIRSQLAAGTYRENIGERLDNTVYRPIIERLIERMRVG